MVPPLHIDAAFVGPMESPKSVRNYHLPWKEPISRHWLIRKTCVFQPVTWYLLLNRLIFSKWTHTGRICQQVTLLLPIGLSWATSTMSHNWNFILEEGGNQWYLASPSSSFYQWHCESLKFRKLGKDKENSINWAPPNIYQIASKFAKPSKEELRNTKEMEKWLILSRSDTQKI